jgi:hypothetical protein
VGGQEIQSLRASKATVEHSLRQSLQARSHTLAVL